jgi:DNA-binding response OmpR family regulator
MQYVSSSKKKRVTVTQGVKHATKRRNPIDCKLAAIKGDPALASIPVVLMSIDDQKNRGYALGAADYLVKPVDRAKLVETLTGICGSAASNALLVDDDDVVRRGCARRWSRSAVRRPRQRTVRLRLNRSPPRKPT